MELLGDIGPWGVAAAGAIVFFGALIQGSIGIGFGLFTSPLLALVDPRLVPALVLILGTFAAIVPALRGRREIVPKELGIGIVGRLIGASTAAAVFGYIVDRAALSLTFGIIVLVAVGLSLTPLRFAFNDRNLLLASIASGAMGTFTGIGAPPMGLLYQRESAAKIRATLNAFFGLGAGISCFFLISFGVLGPDHFIAAAAAIPGLALGVVAAGFVRHPPGQRIRAAILVICTVSSVVLVLRGLGIA